VADIRAMLTSNSQHWCTPPELCNEVHDFFGGWPELDPASNPFSFMQAQRRWTLPFNEDEALEFIAKKVMKKADRAPTPEEREAILAWGDEYDISCRAQGLEFRNALTSAWGDRDGIEHPWVAQSGWLNPPYDWVSDFMDLCSTAPGEWLALTPTRSSARWFHRCVLRRSAAFLFFDKRIAHTNEHGESAGSAPFDSTLSYFGQYPERFKKHFGHLGEVIL
jgi:hypothetical protein